MLHLLGKFYLAVGRKEWRGGRVQMGGKRRDAYEGRDLWFRELGRKEELIEWEPLCFFEHCARKRENVAGTYRLKSSCLLMTIFLRPASGLNLDGIPSQLFLPMITTFISSSPLPSPTSEDAFVRELCFVTAAK